MAPNNANFLGFKPKNWLKNDWVWGNLVFKDSKLPYMQTWLELALNQPCLGGLGLPSLVIAKYY